MTVIIGIVFPVEISSNKLEHRRMLAKTDLSKVCVLAKLTLSLLSSLPVVSPGITASGL
jgi:hypothetical protein